MNAVEINKTKLHEKFIEKVSQGIIFYKQPFLPHEVKYIFDSIDKAEKLNKYENENWIAIERKVWDLVRQENKQFKAELEVLEETKSKQGNELQVKVLEIEEFKKTIQNLRQELLGDN